LALIMTDQNKNQRKKAGGWGAVRPYVEKLEKPVLLALVKDLYDAAAENRDFIEARCRPEDRAAVLEKYRRKVIEHFFPARGEAKLKLGEARKAIRDYRSATQNVSGTTELLLTFVENGTRFTHDYGDIDERFYNGVESALDELATLLRDEARALYPGYAERLAKVERMSRGIGWGFHDFVADVIGSLEHELEEQ
jgi:hypothetical protein